MKLGIARLSLLKPLKSQEVAGSKLGACMIPFERYISNQKMREGEKRLGTK
jgi:hypothetical protein